MWLYTTALVPDGAAAARRYRIDELSDTIAKLIC